MCPEELLKLFRKNLTRLRESRGLSMSELGRRAGKKPSYVCDHERGRRKDVTLSTLAKLASGLDVQPYKLIQESQQDV